MASYRFGEGIGTGTADGSANGNGGTLVNGPLWTAAGKYGTAINFDGSNDFVRVPDSPSLDIGLAGTIEAWVKLDRLNLWHGVVAKADANRNQSHNYALEVNKTNRWMCILGNGISSITLQSPAAPQTNQFYHVACVWNGTSVQLYVGGTPVASTLQLLTPLANTSPLYIGQFGGNTDRLDGTIDEVRIYKRALTQAEVQADMNTPL
jgi:hypothetical protein